MSKRRMTGLGVVLLLVAFLVVGIAGTAFAAQPAEVGDPKTTTGNNEVVKISITGGPTGGSFTLTLGAETSAAIAYNANAATVASTADTAWTANSVTGAGGPLPGSPVNLTIAPAGNVGAITADSTGLTGGTSPTVVVTVLRDGWGAGADVSPHGGYSQNTDYCLQCHKQHGAYAPGTGWQYDTGAYALLRSQSVVETCNTCHSMYGSTIGSLHNPGLPGAEATVSSRAVYENGQPANHSSLDETSCAALIGADRPTNCNYPDVPKAETPGVYGHKIGYGMSAASLGSNPVTPNRTFFMGPNYNATVWNSTMTPLTLPANSNEQTGPGTASMAAGGIYCDSCHTPHGADRGLAVNTEKTEAGWVDGATIYWENTTGALAAGVANGSTGQVHLDDDAAYSGYGWGVCDLADANCVPATVANEQGEQVSLYAYQLLTMANRQYQGVTPATNANLCSNGLPGTETPATTADCVALYGAGTTAGLAASGPLNSTSFKIANNGADASAWCGNCHVYAVDQSVGGTIHAHPTACSACHGNPADGAGKPDFPHTTVEEAMLKELPDALCITCHINLP